MNKLDKRLKALHMRKSGASINRIASQLDIAKSTASLWCQNVVLTLSQRKRLRQNSTESGKKGRMLGAEMNKKKKQNIILRYQQEARVILQQFSERDLLIAGTCLYWGEGAKTESRLLFINSDPDMILLAHRFMTEILHIDKRQIRITIQVNRIHKERIGKIEKFWSQLLRFPANQFDNPYYVNVVPKKIYPNHDTYYGIVRLRALKSASLQYRVLGLIDALKQHSKPV